MSSSIRIGIMNVPSLLASLAAALASSLVFGEPSVIISSKFVRSTGAPLRVDWQELSAPVMSVIPPLYSSLFIVFTACLDDSSVSAMTASSPK